MKVHFVPRLGTLANLPRAFSRTPESSGCRYWMPQQLDCSSVSFVCQDHGQESNQVRAQVGEAARRQDGKAPRTTQQAEVDQIADAHTARRRDSGRPSRASNRSFGDERSSFWAALLGLTAKRTADGIKERGQQGGEENDDDDDQDG